MCINGAAAEHLPDETPTCLCNVEFNLEPEQKWLPEWRTNASNGNMILICPNCSYFVGPFTNKQATIALWIATSRHHDMHILSLWRKDYYRQKQAA